MARKRKQIKQIAEPGQVAIYIRVSTRRQVESGLGLAAQLSACDEYTKRQGLQVSHIFKEKGISTKVPLHRRPLGRELLSLIDTGQISGVVALRLDRPFRSVTDCLGSLDSWADRGVALHLVDFAGQSVDTRNALGRLFITLLAGFAEFERNILSQRVKEALEEKKKKNQYLGKIPYGFRVSKSDGKTLVKDELEWSMVCKILRLKAKGLAFKAIAVNLNDRKQYKRFRPWNLYSVRRVFLRYQEDEE
jgi:DNA invertase Pin-like site-specific DNA recombinase